MKQYSKEHKILAEWAIDCLDRYLPLFKRKYPQETIPDTALATLRKWMSGELKMWDARKYTYTVLAFAKQLEKNDPVYTKLVRATHHCLATCHVPTHSEGTAMYVISFIQQVNQGNEKVLELMTQERQWQLERLQQLMVEN